MAASLHLRDAAASMLGQRHVKCSDVDMQRSASSFCPACRSGDLLRTFTDAEDDMQLYWEAFPAAGGSMRTTCEWLQHSGHFNAGPGSSLAQAAVGIHCQSAAFSAL